MHTRTFSIVVSVAVALGAASAAPARQPQPFQPAWAQFQTGKEGIKLPMIQRSVLTNIEGRLDHMAFDLKSGRLYVACKGAGSVEALDASGMKTIQSIKDLPEPMGAAFSQDLRRLYVSCGDGNVRAYKADDAGELTLERTVEFRGEADPIRIDPESKRVYVGFGKFLSWFDGETGAKGPEVELPGIASSIVLERNGPRAFVNIPKRGEIAVVDREKGTVVATWKLKDASGNHAMAADQDSGRLFVAARSPAVLLVLDMKDGREVQRLEISPDADDAWFDARGKRVYVSCGGGGGAAVMVLQETPDTYTLEHSERTNAGAASSLLIPEKRRLIVGAPKVGPDGYTFLYIYILPP